MSKPVPLYPEIEPFHTGTLKVGQGHTMTFFQSGNPKGQPLIMLHGGPGMAGSPKHRRYAHPKTTHIITYDQRGAGQSTPVGSITGNTTQHLVEDIEALRQHLNLGQVTLMGGSWGSTLALAYAEAYPDNVSGILVSGILLGTKSECDTWFTSPEGVARFFPSEYARVCEALGNPKPKELMQQLNKVLNGKDKKKAYTAARAYVTFEGLACQFEPNRAKFEQELDEWKTLLESMRIEIHYLANNCFLKPNQLLNNIHKIAHIPMHIVQGAYDLVCPPASALALHAAHPTSTLHWIQLEGHIGGEEGISTRIKALKQLLKQAKA